MFVPGTSLASRAVASRSAVRALAPSPSPVAVPALAARRSGSSHRARARSPTPAPAPPRGVTLRATDPTSDVPPPSHPSPVPAKPKMSPLGYVNESTKFLVSGTALAVLLTHPNVHVVWCMIGSVVNSLGGKALKKALNHERPDGAAKADPGMPSSHAVSLSYMSVYAAAALLRRGGGFPANPGAWPVPEWSAEPLAAALIALGLFFTWLRVALGYHTVPQVVVGYVLGAGVALGWLHVGETVVGPAAAADPGTARALYAACIVTSLLFARLAVRWIDEASEWVRKKREKKEAKRI